MGIVFGSVVEFVPLRECSWERNVLIVKEGSGSLEERKRLSG